MTRASELDRDSPLPLWAQLYDRLVARLVAGEFRDDFPGELDLAEEYGVSRNTVREAMRRLRDEGTIIAERGRRPRVAPTPLIEQPLGAIYTLYDAVEAAGLDQQSVVRVRDTRRDPAAARELGRDAADPLFFLERLRLAGGEPLALDRVWLPADVGADLRDADFSHTALYTELQRRAGVRLVTGREQIRAVVPAPDDRALLDLPADVAALAISRHTRDAERTVEWRVTLIRGDRFALIADFSPLTGYPLDARAVAPSRPAP